MKIAIINDIHAGKPLIYKGGVRASSEKVETVLPQLLEDIILQHDPDLIVNLGDLIRSENKEIDQSLFQKMVGYFKKVSCPVIHMVGNHEVKKMEIGEIESIWEQEGFSQKSYGAFRAGDIQIVWLGMELSSSSLWTLPKEQLSWLKKRVEEPFSTLVFTHMAIDEHNLSGNFFNEVFQSNSGFFLQNQMVIRSLFRGSNVKAVFQAHLHYFHVKMVEEIPYITCPAMGDNICGPNVEVNIPEIYTLVTLQERQMVVKAYSKEYCFAGTEFLI